MYLLEMIIREKNGNFLKEIKEVKKDQEEAHELREKVLDELTDGQYASYDKVIPVVDCACGELVLCTNFTNTCSCGADYNFAGDRLAPRSQWGEETGESWPDCY